MARQGLEDILRHFKRLLAPTADEWTDRHLLERYTRQRDEAAFASLVRRHGALVLGVGRRILRQEDAEDVFQATFLILARKASSGRWRKSIAGWLYCVAYRLATRTRARIARRRAAEGEAGNVYGRNRATSEGFPELSAVLDDELHRLADQYREPLLLCYLEGKTRDQAARQLRWSARTLERRLEAGLKLLRVRLSKRGVELPVALLAAGLSQPAASACVSAKAVAAAVDAALAFGPGGMAAGTVISSKVLAMAEGGLKAMSITKMKIGALLLLSSSVVVAGIGVLGYRLAAMEKAQPNPAVEIRQAQAPVVETWPEGATVKGRVLDHKGVAVADAEILLLGKERIIVDADRRTWFVFPGKKDDEKPPSTRTNANGEFTIERKKGEANRLAVIARDPLLWEISRKSLARGDSVEIKLPPSGSLEVTCDLPGKAPKQPVNVELRTFDETDWDIDILRFHFGSFSVTNPGSATFEHLPPGIFAVQRMLETPIGKGSNLLSPADRQLAKVDSNKRATVRLELKAGRPLTGRVVGLDNADFSRGHVTIMYAGPRERFRDGKLGQQMSTFDVIPIKSDGRFTANSIPPGKYHLWIDAVRASSLEQSSQQSDFDGQIEFTVPERGDIPKVEVVAKPNTRPRPPNKDYRVRVVDEAGKAVPALQAMIHSEDCGYTHWKAGRDGVVSLGEPSQFRDAGAIDVLVRADGHAACVTRFEGKLRDKLQEDGVVITMRRGQKVELQFRLPKGLTWPKGMVPESYFSDYEERVRIERQPATRKGEREFNILSDFNMLNLREAGAGRFAFRLAPDTPLFHVAIHAPGFLQHFESGPFTLANFKDGKLEIEIPRPASVDVRFDPATKNLDELPFKSVSLEVWRQTHGNSYVDVATESSSRLNAELKRNDLSPGTYRVAVRTQPNADSKKIPGTDIRLGAYYDSKTLVLQAGKSDHINFRWTPFDPQAFRGGRTAVVRLKMPDGSPAKGKRLKVDWFDGHYGGLPVYSGIIPDSGNVTLKGITDRNTDPRRDHSYTVTVDDRRVGHFGFTKEGPTQEFEFHLAPNAGDLAPDVELINIATGKPLRLSSLRGKVVCLEFWATWCGPCQPAMAKLNGWSAEKNPSWKDRVAIVPVSIDAARDRVRPHALKRGWTALEHYWAGDKTSLEFDAQAARAFVLYGVPEAILIGSDGRILWRGHPMDKSAGQDLKSRIEAELK